MGLPARYEIVEDNRNGPLVLRDLGPWNKHFTITNDARNVLKDLCDRGLVGPKSGKHRRLFYYDREGELMEIRFDERTGEFRGFGPGIPQHVREGK